jgi:CSLREA domain-containing protein
MPARAARIAWVCIVSVLVVAGSARAATFVVNDTGDASDASAGNGVCATAAAVCTLRAAIEESNALAGADTITFNIGAGGLQTITPTSALPTISTEVDIDATTQPGFAGTPLIKIVGTSAPQAIGLHIAGANSSARGLILVGFGNKGVQVNADGVVVAGNYIGVTETGAAQGNGTAPAPGGAGIGAGGVLVSLGDFPNTIIGGTTAADRNVVSGNSYGIQLLCASNVRVQGNYIGLDPTGTLARPNSSFAVHVSTDTAGFGGCGASANNNVIGGDIAGAGNVVSGNASDGIVIGLRASGTLSGNRIQGNMVGLAADGTTLVPNGTSVTGIRIVGAYPGVGAATNTLIGGTTALARNVLAGNGAGSTGIWVGQSSIGAASPASTTIQGNYVGLDQSGTLARGFTTGINVGGTSTIIGGTAAGARNVVAGNVTHNILVEPNGATIQGNFVGTTAAGTAALTPTSFGILVKAPNTVVGGTTPEARNVISGNYNGLFLSGSSQVTVTGVTVHGNYIGTDAAGTAAVPNAGSGVVVDAPGLTVGGTGAGMGNVIAGNIFNGVYLLQTSWGVVSGVSVLGNRIGVNASGNPLGNGAHGVRIDNGVSGAIVGGTGAGEANIIANNASRGVLLLGGTGTAVRGNRIDASGSLGFDNYDTPLVDANDALDADTGTNGRQNFPVVLASTIQAGGLLQVQGTLDSKPSTTYWIDAYANASCDASNNGEGDVYVGSSQVLTDGSGHAAFSIGGVAVPGKPVITTTATGPEGTSEFSQCRTAVTPSVTISGYVTHGSGPGASPLAAVTMTLGGDTSATTVTAANGYYEFGGLASGGAHTVTASLAGVVFTPASRSLSNLTADQGGQDFVGTRLYTISGTVRDLNDTGVAGVTITVTGSASSTQTTGLDGGYSVTVPEGGTYTVTPSRGSFVFDPASQTFPGLAKDEVAGFFVAQVGQFTRYFAEGATGGFFDTRFAVLNATGRDATVLMRFQRPAPAPEVTSTFQLAGLQRTTVDPKTLGLTEAEFSTVIESDQPVIADRLMTWDATAYGSHAETSIARPLTRWFLAEGATIDGFELFYLVQNPADTTAQIQVRYLLPAPQAPVVKTHDVLPRSRFNIWVNLEDPALADAEVSAVITSLNDVPVIVERAMYRNIGTKMFGAGHGSAGVEAPADTWFFGEGATGPFFDLFFLVANPNPGASQIEARYLKPDGTVVFRSYDVAGNSRFNIWVDLEGDDLADTSVATTFRVLSGGPVIVERAMWWGRPTWYEGHNTAGATQTGEKWGLAEGESDGPFEVATYVLLGNVSDRPGTARVTLTFEDSTQAVREFALPPSSRTNVAVNVHFPESAGKRYGVVVESTGESPVQLVVERATYNDSDGVLWAAGTSALGTRLR